MLNFLMRWGTQVCRLCSMVKEILAKEDNVKAVRAPVIVVGDGSPHPNTGVPRS